jgi:hypothetical protein
MVAIEKAMGCFGSEESNLPEIHLAGASLSSSANVDTNP